MPNFLTHLWSRLRLTKPQPPPVTMPFPSVDTIALHALLEMRSRHLYWDGALQDSIRPQGPPLTATEVRARMQAQQEEHPWPWIDDIPAHDPFSPSIRDLLPSEERAKGLLIANLYPIQKYHFTKHNIVPVLGEHTGHYYVLFSRYSYNIYCLTTNMASCLMLPDCPLWDQLLAQKFALELSELDALRRANTYHNTSYRAIIPPELLTSPFRSKNLCEFST